MGVPMFRTLGEAIHELVSTGIPVTFNTFAVILEVRKLSRTCRDFQVYINLTCPSLREHNLEHLQLIAFAEDASRLPTQCRLGYPANDSRRGDIMRLRHVVLQKWKGSSSTIQLLGNSHLLYSMFPPAAHGSNASEDPYEFNHPSASRPVAPGGVEALCLSRLRDHVATHLLRCSTAPPPAAYPAQPCRAEGGRKRPALAAPAEAPTAAPALRSLPAAAVSAPTAAAAAFGPAGPANAPQSGPASTASRHPVHLVAPEVGPPKRGLSKISGLAERLAGHTSLHLVDLIVKVVAVDERYEHATVMFVWDGSDACPMASTSQAVHKSATLGATSLWPVPPPQRRFAVPLLPLPGIALSTAALHTLGTVVPVLLPLEGAAEAVAQATAAVGSWVKLKCLALTVVEGQVQGAWTRESRLVQRACLRHGDNVYVHQAERLVGERLASGRAAGLDGINAWAPLAASGFRTVCTADPLGSSAVVCTLREVLQLGQAGAGAQRTLRVHARATRYAPTAAEGERRLCRPSCEYGALGGEPGVGASVCCVTLLLEDATGQLDAMVFAEDADAFFGAPPPARLEAPHLADLHHRLAALVAPAAHPCDGWVDCCIRTVFTDTSDPSDLRRPLYRLTHAVLR